VSPTIFELHAGSTNKRPPEYIFLENGSSLRDVMNTFLNIPLDTLEEVVQKILGDFTMRTSKFCVNCRGLNFFYPFCVIVYLFQILTNNIQLLYLLLKVSMSYQNYSVIHVWNY